MATLAQQLFRRKPIPADGGESESGLKRTIGTFQLTMLGVGCTVGTGIFFILSEAVPVAGPSVILSFIIAGVVAGLSVLCYCELSSSIPSSGSSYSFTYSSMGEFPAMIVAGCLMLEYAVSTATVAVGWSQYVNQLLNNLFGFKIPEALAYAPDEGGIINLPAVILIAGCAVLLLRGTKESAVTNTILTVLKVSALIFFAGVAFTGWNADNFAEFAPYGVNGVMAGAGLIFFSFVGLDAVSTAGDEAKNPRRAVPIALIASLLVIMAVYVLVAIAALGAQRSEDFEGQSAGLSVILENVVGSSWPGTVVAATAVVSIFSCVLVTIYGQTRILHAMSSDGMAPRSFNKINPKTMVPTTCISVVCIGIGLLAALLPINFLAELTSLGTLIAFIFVSLSVLVLRRSAPNMERKIKLPLHPLIPLLAIAGCVWIVKDLTPSTWLVFIVWVGALLVIYFATAFRTSVLAQKQAAGETDTFNAEDKDKTLHD